MISSERKKGESCGSRLLFYSDFSLYSRDQCGYAVWSAKGLLTIKP